MTDFLARLSLRSEEVLLRELNHRINNEFASAISVISISAVRSEDPAVKGALSDVVDMLHQYANVHRALTVPDRQTLTDAAEYLQTLCLAITRSKLDHLGIRLVFSADRLLLQSDRCWRLGMIVYELLTNAARHARFDGRAGEVSVELTHTGTFVTCKVTDNGTAPEAVRGGRGSKIIGEIAQSLGCTINSSFAERSYFMLAFPLAEPEWRASRSGEGAKSFAVQIST